MREAEASSRATKRGALTCASGTKTGASHPGNAKRARTTSYTHGNPAEGGLDNSAMSEGEHRGSHPRRWSPEEDDRLRASVDKHQGTNWKEIAKEVKTRNHVQCLQRWKKVLTPGLVKGQWTPEEDQLLVSVVNEGHKNWGSLSARIPGRTSKQCRERWCHHLDPRIVKGQWTAAEDEIIVSMQKQIGNKWAQIAQQLDGRTENATKIRWKILERELKRDGDEREEEKAAASVLSKTGNPDEVPIGVPRDAVAAYRDHGESSEDTVGLPRPLPSAGRTGERGASRADITQGVSPANGVGLGKRAGSGGGNGGHDGQNCARRGWLAEEDERLKEAVEEFGERNWREVARNVRTRNHIQCQQRWKKALRPGLVKGAWNAEEDEKLVTLIGQGFSNWSELAANTGRTAKQCRERWMHHLDPSLRHVSWTSEEDQLLISLEARLGKKWAAIAREIPGRTEHAVKGRFKTLSRERDLDRQAGSRRANKRLVDQEPTSSKVGHEAPVPSSLGERHVLARIVSGEGLGSTKSGGHPGSGNGARSGGAATAGGRDFAAGAIVGGAAAAAGTGDSMEQAMQRWQHLEVRPQEQRVANAQQMLNLNLCAQAQEPRTTTPSAPSTAMAATTQRNATAANDDGEASIARLLSIGSVKTDPSLSEVTSGYCGHGRNDTKSSDNTSIIADISRLARKQSAVEPRLPVAELGTEGNPPVLPGNRLAPRPFDGHTSDFAGEGSSLVNRIDYSDLASILMDGGFDACKDRVESEGEAVTLGEDPYSDYSLSAGDHIIMGYGPANFSRMPPGSGPPQQMPAQYASVHGPPLESALGASSDLGDSLPPSVFEGGGAADDPSDPYYF
eukprot:g8092.t1